MYLPSDDCHHVFGYQHCQICCALCKVSAVMYLPSDDCHHVFCCFLASKEEFNDLFQVIDAGVYKFLFVIILWLSVSYIHW